MKPFRLSTHRPEPIVNTRPHRYRLARTLLPAFLLLTLFVSTAAAALPGYIKGYVYDNLHNPIANAAVSVFSGNSLVGQANSIPGGAFIFVLPPGTYWVSASAVGYASGQSGPFSLTSGGVQNVTIMVTIIQHTLQILWSGSGAGQVTGGISCQSGSSCSGAYQYGADFTLHATPDWKSLFAGWDTSECESIDVNGDCHLTMSSDNTVHVPFIANYQARVNNQDYLTLYDAYSDAATTDGDTIKLKAEAVFFESILLDREKNITIDGGYTDLSGDSTGGSATINGTGGEYTLSIRNGRLTVKGITIR